MLMITAYATPKLAVEAIKAGAIDYLAKPFEPEELLHAGRAVRRAVSPAQGKRFPARAHDGARGRGPDHRRIASNAGVEAADPDGGRI